MLKIQNIWKWLYSRISRLLFYCIYGSCFHTYFVTMPDTKNSKGWGHGLQFVICQNSSIYVRIGMEEYSLYLYAIKIGYLWLFLTARYLSLGNLRDANYLMDELKKQVNSKELEFPESELMQFISYLLLT